MRKKQLLVILLISIFCCSIFLRMNSTNSTTIELDKIQIVINKIAVTDELAKVWFFSTWYFMEIEPMYKRHFGTWGDRLQNSDFQYEDWIGSSNRYPAGIEANKIKVYSNILNIEYSYCLPFEDDDKSELSLSFTLHRRNPHGKHVFTKEFNNLDYGVMYSSGDLNYRNYGGHVTVYFTVNLL